MRKPRGKRAQHNQRSAAELCAKRHRSEDEEPGVHVCLPSRPPSAFPDLCYVDATPGAVEEAGATNAASGEQLMGGRPADAASPPPGELCCVLPL